MRISFRCFLTLLTLILAASGISAQEIRVAAAADLKFAMKELAEEFESRAQTKVNVTYGSSGNFFAQIQNGAPFDLFFSADIGYPEKLKATGLAEPGTLFVYAVGRIVIWMPAEAKTNLQNRGWRVLLDAGVQTIAIANPEHAPYGRAAVAALQKAGIYESVKGKLVFGENISQAAQFVQSGNAQAGIIARSLALSPGMKDGEIWEIPGDMHPSIEQAAILLKSARNKQAALKFLDFVKSESGRRILETYGLEIPQSRSKGEIRH
jgi:molybdate transport system substrate-binding protein